VAACHAHGDVAVVLVLPAHCMGAVGMQVHECAGAWHPSTNTQTYAVHHGFQYRTPAHPCIAALLPLLVPLQFLDTHAPGLQRELMLMTPREYFAGQLKKWC
jgi:hypothetical protein